MAKHILLALALLVSVSISAQDLDDDPDWQTGGGRDTTAYYMGHNVVLKNDEYDRPRLQSLYKGGYREHPVEVYFGYVNKDWTTKTSNGTIHENFFGERGLRLHGFQFGFTYQPCFDFGLGLRTGAAMEAYISTSDYVKEHGYDSFSELSFYVPLHAVYRFPLTHYASVSIFYGLGFNYAAKGTYYEESEHYDPYRDAWVTDNYSVNQQYGGNWPRRFNVACEFGASVRISKAKISFTYSKGLSRHHLHAGSPSFQNKLNITVGYIIPDW